MSEPNLLDTAKRHLADLIAFPTISSDSNLDLIAYLAERLDDTGAEIMLDHDETGMKANLFATLGPNIEGGMVLSGHTDVVPVEGQTWQSDPFEMVERGGKLFGRGTCDMKGFVAACLAMAPVFATWPLRRPVHFAFTYDEEVGCFGAQALLKVLDRADIRPGMAIIGEPTEMRVIEGHKGCYEYTTEIGGIEAHSAVPDTGVSAIEPAVLFVNRLLELGDDVKATAPPTSRFQPPHTTVHVGRIHGGTARNIIAPHCTIDWEIRPVQRRDADHVKATMQRFVDTRLLPVIIARNPDVAIETRTICEVEGFEPVAVSEARDLVMRLTGANATDVVAFGTEAGLFQAAGISAIICGPGSIAQAHKADEFIALDQLDACLALLAKLETSLI